MSDCEKCGLSPEFHDQYDCEAMASTVTITISRKAAKKVADWPEDERFPFSSEFGKAARAALEGER